MPGVGESIALSIGLALMTCLFSLVLMLPTLLILHLKAPQMLPVAEGFSVLPYVVPAIALVSAVGPLYRIILPQALNSPLGLVPLYMVVIMPFVYRSLDAGIRVVDVRTLWDASSSLGAGAVTTLVRAILPNLRSAIMSASLLGCAIVLGEFAIAQLLLKTTLLFRQGVQNWWNNVCWIMSGFKHGLNWLKRKSCYRVCFMNAE